MKLKLTLVAAAVVVACAGLLSEDSVAAGGVLVLEPPRKSVAYQPEPLS